MFIVTVTVHNSAEVDCRRLKLTDSMVFDSPEPEPIAEFVRQVEDNHRAMFPKGMSYVVPYTEVTLEADEVLYAREQGVKNVEMIAS